MGAHPNNKPRRGGREDEALIVRVSSIDRLTPKGREGMEGTGFPFVLLFCLVLCVERRSTDDDDDDNKLFKGPQSISNS